MFVKYKTLGFQIIRYSHLVYKSPHEYGIFAAEKET
jgi:hypothetical protein